MCISLQGKGEMRTFYINGEDKERRMARLAPPDGMTNNNNTVNNTTSKLGPTRSLKKISSVPSLRGSQRRYHSCDKDDVGTDPVGGEKSNGYISLRGIKLEKEELSLCGKAANSATTWAGRRRRSEDFGSRSYFIPAKRASCRLPQTPHVAMEDECMPCQTLVVVPPGVSGAHGDAASGSLEEDDDWACHPASSGDAGHCHEESPLLRFPSLRERPLTGCAQLGQSRSLSGETQV